MDLGLCRSVRTGSASGLVVELHRGYVNLDVGGFKLARVAGGGKKASFLYQEAVGCNRQRCMMVKSAPVPALEMSQAKFLLEFFVVALDAPA